MGLLVILTFCMEMGENVIHGKVETATGKELGAPKYGGALYS